MNKTMQYNEQAREKVREGRFERSLGEYCRSSRENVRESRRRCTTSDATNAGGEDRLFGATGDFVSGRPGSCNSTVAFSGPVRHNQ